MPLPVNGWVFIIAGFIFSVLGPLSVYYGQDLLKRHATVAADKAKLDDLSREIAAFVQARPSGLDAESLKRFDAQFWTRIVLLRDKIGRDYAEGDVRLNAAPRTRDEVLSLDTRAFHSRSSGMSYDDGHAGSGSTGVRRGHGAKFQSVYVPRNWHREQWTSWVVPRGRFRGIENMDPEPIQIDTLPEQSSRAGLDTNEPGYYIPFEQCVQCPVR